MTTSDILFADFADYENLFEADDVVDGAPCRDLFVETRDSILASLPVGDLIRAGVTPGAMVDSVTRFLVK